MTEPAKASVPAWMEFLVVTTAAVWFGAIGFFLGFLLSDGMGWIQVKRLGNVADAPAPDFPQWLAWAVPCVAGLAAAGAGARLGRVLVGKIGMVGEERNKG